MVDRTDIQTPTLAEAITSAIEAGKSRMRVGMPGIIESYNATEQSCSVQPAFKNDDGTDAPVITRVPVQFPRGGGFIHSFPLSRGDPCWVTFGERDIETWLNSGQKSIPAIVRMFDWSDAVVEPGVSPYTDPSPLASQTDMVIGLENTMMVIRISPTGRITIGNEGTGVDLLQLIDDVWRQLQIATVLTFTGPKPVDQATVTAVGIARVSLQSIKG